MIYLKIDSSIFLFGGISKMKKEDNSSSMLQLFFFYFTFAPAKEPKDLNLIIDIGNTKAKIAFFDGGEMVDVVAGLLESSLFSISG